jgi:hypothetical protein
MLIILISPNIELQEFQISICMLKRKLKQAKHDAQLHTLTNISVKFHDTKSNMF